MLLVISPAKTLDYETQASTKVFTQPDFLGDAETLVDDLRALSPPALAKLMGLSAKLSELNFGRYLDWQQPFTPDNAKQSILAFKGDVYTGLDAQSFSAKDFKYAQKHLRILSGLYGVLRPLDLMQPYRLEMGTKFENSRGKDLYAFWGTTVTDALNKQMKSLKTDVLINLASNEYFKAVDKKQLMAEIVTPVFKDYKNGQYKIISFYAKKARGMMASYIIRNQVADIAGLKRFSQQGYQYNKSMSNASELVFTRAAS